MKKIYNVSLTCNLKESHPDLSYLANPKEKITFEDKYTIDSDYYNKEDAISFIKNDILLVANGGYSYNHVTNVELVINGIKY